MEKRNNNGILVGILIGIIIMLLVIIGLFATGAINFKTTTTNDSEKTSENNQTDNNEETKEMTKEEATSILKEAADRIGNVSNGYPYCGENMKYDEADVILDEHNISTHSASKDYTSLDNMKDDLKKYMSDELIKKYIDDTNYIGKDQKLYCRVYHKGSILYDKNNSSYNVETFTNDEIIASGIIATYGEGDEYKNNVKIEMKKNNDNWQITKYEIQNK